MGITEIANPALLWKYDYSRSEMHEQNSQGGKHVTVKTVYNQNLDKIVSFREGYFGPKLWQLPLFMLPAEDSEDQAQKLGKQDSSLISDSVIQEKI
jgi:hypothetical protein